MKKLRPATLFKMHVGTDKCPEIGETVLSAIMVNGNVCVVDQNGKIIQGLKSASISSDIKGVSLITLTVGSKVEVDEEDAEMIKIAGIDADNLITADALVNAMNSQ